MGQVADLPPSSAGPAPSPLVVGCPRERSGAGASCGLQNRCPAPVAASGVGSIPMRFRQ